MNLPDNNPISSDRLEALFKQREAAFQEEIYKSYAMAATSETYYSIQKIAIAVLQHDITIAAIYSGNVVNAIDTKDGFANAVVTRAIAIHEQIENYCRQQHEEKSNATQSPQQND